MYRTRTQEDDYTAVVAADKKAAADKAIGQKAAADKVASDKTAAKKAVVDKKAAANKKAVSNKAVSKSKAAEDAEFDTLLKQLATVHSAQEGRSSLPWTRRRAARRRLTT